MSKHLRASMYAVCGATLGIAITSFSTISNAADLLPPPPPPAVEVVEIRETVKDWTGGYLGAVLGGTCMDTYYVPSAGANPELNGCGWSGGGVVGYNYQVGKAVYGVEADWTLGTRTAENVLDAVKYNIDWQSSIRGRLGWLVTDKTLFYGTAGLGWMRGTMNALVGPGSVPMKDAHTHFGFVAGGGIEHAFTSNLHWRFEYLYANYNKKRYDLNVVAVCGVPCRADLKASAVHTMRVGLTYNFSMGTW